MDSVWGKDLSTGAGVFMSWGSYMKMQNCIFVSWGKVGGVSPRVTEQGAKV